MLSRVQDAAAAKVKRSPRGHALGRSLAAMEGLRGRKIDAAPALRACAHRKVEVLIVDKKALVESAERLEHAAADKEERAHHLIHHPGFVVRPFDDEVRRKKMWHEPVEPDTVADHRPRGRCTRGVARDMAVRVHQLDAEDANLLILAQAQVTDRLRKTPRQQLRVRIEEQEKLRIRSRGALVAGGAEAAILAVADDVEREGSLDGFARSVVRSGVA